MVPYLPSPEKVTTPFTAFTEVVPVNVPESIATDTLAVELVTRLFEAS